MRAAIFTGVVALGGLLFIGSSSAHAQGYGYPGGGYGGGYPGGGYGGGYPGGGYGGGYHGGGYGVPSSSYYGNGGHDLQPHMHTRQTPFGSYSYYGMGQHDFRPHGHVETPYGITGSSNGRFSSTQSDSPPSPYIYRPW